MEGRGTNILFTQTSGAIIAQFKDIMEEPIAVKITQSWDTLTSLWHISSTRYDFQKVAKEVRSMQPYLKYQANLRLTCSEHLR